MPVHTMKTKTTTQMKKAMEVYDKAAVNFMFKDNVKKNLRIMDEQNFVNRYKWYNLPDGIDGQFLERMLYYKYQLAIFYMESNDTFYILPFTFTKDIDVYGRWKYISPLPFTNGKVENGKEKVWIPGLTKTIVNDIALEVDWNKFTESAVILKDYTNQLAESQIPRSMLQEQIIDYEAEILSMHRTALMNSTGTNAVRVNDESDAANVAALNDQTHIAALTGMKYLATVSSIEMQNLDGAKTANPQEFMTALASIDNLRLSMLGLDNGGIQEKQGTIINAEATAGKINTGSILQDGLMQRLKWCDIVNSIWGLGVWCEVNQDFDIMTEENASMMPQVSDVGSESEGTEND